MGALTTELAYIMDITESVKEVKLEQPLTKGDAYAHRIAVTVKNNGTPLDLTGGSCVFICAFGQTKHRPF